MPVARKSASEYATDIRAAIANRTARYDTGVLAIPDVMVLPHAAVLEAQNEQLRKVSLVVSASNEAEFDGVEFSSDLEALVGNEGLLRSLGGRSTVTATFYRQTTPLADVVVPRGYPVGSLPDEASGATIVFVTIETQTMLAASAASYYVAARSRYELDVAVVAAVVGQSGRVAVGRVARELRPLVGFDGVTNLATAAGGRDAETNRELIARYRLAVVGQQLSTPNGILRNIRDRYPDVRDVITVYGTDELLTRAATDAGAVDVYVIGDQLLEATESLTYYGVGQTMAVANPPLRAVLDVVQGATVYVAADDYDAVDDTSGYGGSTRAVDGIAFRAGGTQPLPVVGSLVDVTYTYNALIRVLQTESTGEDRAVLERDLLHREGVAVPVTIAANLRVGVGFSAITVLAAVRARVLDLVNVRRGFGARALDDTTALPGALEISDIQGDVRQVTGVDNFTLTTLRRSSAAAGAVVDLTITRNEYPTLADADLVVTLV